MSLRKKYLYIVLLGVGTLVLWNCTKGQIRDTSQDATLAVIDTAVQDEPRKKILDAVLKSLKDPEVGNLVRDVIHGFMKNAGEEAHTDFERKIEPLASSLTRVLLKAAKEQGGLLFKDLAPEAEKSLHQMIASSVKVAGKSLRKNAHGDLAIATRILVTTAIDSALATIAQRWDQNQDQLSLRLEHFILNRLDPVLEKVVRKLAKEALFGLQEGWQEGKFSERLPPYDRAIHETGFGLGVGIGEGLAVSVAKDPMKPVLVLVASILSAVAVCNLLLVVVFWRKYEHAAKSLVLFVHQLTRLTGTNAQIPDLMHTIESAHKAARHHQWLDRFLKSRGLYPSSGEPREVSENEKKSVE